MERPEAGPSQPAVGSSLKPGSAVASSPPTAAPERPLPNAHFYSVEYPGYVRPTSVPLAIERLGGERTIESAFRRASGRDKVESLLELRLRPGNPYAHPVPGEIVPTSNIVLKVVKRRRKRKDGDAPGEGAGGEYTVEAVGVVPKTARFRSGCSRILSKVHGLMCSALGMADFQYQPDMSDPLAHLRKAMDTMDGVWPRRG